jgi:hypothetical protein
MEGRQTCDTGSENQGTSQEHRQAGTASKVPYQAPYHRMDNEHIYCGNFIVRFHLGHTLAKHFAFLGRDFDVISFNSGYIAEMDEQLLKAVRSDRGVRLVEDDGSGEIDDG